MNNSSSSRILMTVLIVVVGGGAVLFTGNKILWQPYKSKLGLLTALEKDVETKERELLAFQVDQSNVAKWNKLSLRNDIDSASSKYGNMLKAKVGEFGLKEITFNGPPPQQTANAYSAKNKPRHIVLPWVVRGKGTLKAVEQTLEALQRMPVMHRVKSLDLERGDNTEPTGRLNVKIEIEAMIIYGANNELDFDHLDYKEKTLDREYSDMAMVNPFTGYLPPPRLVKGFDPSMMPTEDPLDVLEYVTCNHIETSSSEAWLYNRLFNTKQRIKSIQLSGYERFVIKSEDRSRDLLKGKVLRIDHREIYFQVRDDVYCLHFGQSVAEALRKPLLKEQTDTLELTSLIDEEFGKDGGDGKRAVKAPMKKMQKSPQRGIK